VGKDDSAPEPKAKRIKKTATKKAEVVEIDVTKPVKEPKKKELARKVAVKASDATAKKSKNSKKKGEPKKTLLLIITSKKRKKRNPRKHLKRKKQRSKRRRKQRLPHNLAQIKSLP
jgi:hypothetical protein